jgi:hypothetical protein
MKKGSKNMEGGLVKDAGVEDAGVSAEIEKAPVAAYVAQFLMFLSALRKTPMRLNGQLNTATVFDASANYERPSRVQLDERATVFKLPTVHMLLTPALAKAVYAMGRSFCERKLEPRHIKTLVTELAFRPTQDFRWAVVYCKETKTYHRQNGQHTSCIYATGRLAVPTNAFVALELYEGETRRDVTWLWNKIDHRSEGRTGQQLVEAWASSFVELRDAVPGIANAALAGLCLVNGKWESNADDTERKIHDNLDFITFSNAIVKPHAKRGDKMHKILLRVSVQGALHQMWERDPKATSEFWSMITSGESSAGSPARLCREYLLATNVASGYGRVNAHSDVPLTMKEKCIFCWNSWRRGTRRVATIRLPPDGAPLAVL